MRKSFAGFRCYIFLLLFYSCFDKLSTGLKCPFFWLSEFLHITILTSKFRLFNLL
ncbi:hypothetical protein KsCSTR_21480 [Candidatus Kuenenia stuttgartiensis]|uniref:Lipoprotein n=1 Tax=Kuenenia stuttgartiensis TaxID=174633 RepID=Q1Q333_KUEST|nr:hypothetical protein KsCSTR_21480 [Candidatus Kuenenia stuttgartiensis]CAJ74423.1 unknown protein [Candidatus Kuenenia stuttgartiensis]